VTIENAKIESTHLGFEGHGILTLGITVLRGCIVQSIGGYNYDGQGRANLAQHVREILTVLGVEKWGDVRGYCRVESQNGRLVALGHIVEDRWWRPGGAK